MPLKRKDSGENESGPVRYAVAGLGYIAQAAVLPAFAHAHENSEVTALISNDPVKLRTLGRKYGVRHLFTYDDFARALRSGTFDALYVALPNSKHADFTIDALEAGIHVLCEKPMAPTSSECHAMLAAARMRDRRLMVAYRLHFEEANLEAIRIAESGRLGELRFFSSAFSMNVKPDDIRLKAGLGEGPIYDIGIYCINAARYLFRDEPLEVIAFAESADDRRFAEVHEMVSATLRFPRNRLATFICGFNGAKVSQYRVVGTQGDLLVEPAYELADELRHRLTIGDKKQERKFSKRDQFGPELAHFSDCVLNGREPWPSGEEGLADVLVMEAIEQSLESGRSARVQVKKPPRRPEPSQEMRMRPVRMPKLVGASPPGREKN